MKNAVTMLMTMVATLFAQDVAKENAADWTQNARIVSLRIGTKLQGEALEKCLAELKECGVNTIVDHGGMQFLPDLPDNGKSQWQSQVHYDLAVPFSQAVKRAGFHLIHHTTSTFVRIEALENPLYRQWASENLNTGETALCAPNNAYASACFMDMNHPGFRSFLFGRMLEYAQKTGVDGFQTDEVEWLPDFYACGTKEGSRAAYFRKYGVEMPKGKVDESDVNWRRYISFRFDSGGDFYGALLASLRQANPDMQITGCLAGISKYYRRVWAMGAENWLKNWTMGFYEMEEAGHPKGKRCGFMSCTEFPRYVREMALYQAHAVNNNWKCCYCIGYPSTWKRENSEQFYLWALSLSMGFRYEMRDYQMEGELFKWEAAHEKLFIKPRERNDIGIFFPEQSRDFSDTEEAERVCSDWGGFGEALAWHNIPASQLVRASFAGELPSNLKLVVMPSNDYVSPEMLARLKEFVNRGGILLVSGPCRLADPFAETPMAQDELNAFLGLASRGDKVDGRIECQVAEGKSLPAGAYVFTNGIEKVQAADGATVLASTGEGIPAIVEHLYGKGRVIVFAGRWGCGMTHSGAQKTATYIRGYLPEQRQLFAETVRKLLAGRMGVEVKNLPSKVLFNAHVAGDTGTRILHFLDSYDGCEPGDTIPENQPLRFRQFAERNGGTPVTVLLRDGFVPAEAVLHSYDSPNPLRIVPQFSDADAAWKIAVPATAFGRYSVLEIPMK